MSDTDSPKRKLHCPKKKHGEMREVIIYKIEVAGTDLLYIGSTQDFAQRKKNHSKACRHNLDPASNNNAKNSKIYTEINKVGGWEKATMSPLERIEVDNTQDALIREQYWTDKIQVARRDAIMLNVATANSTTTRNTELVKCGCGVVYKKYSKHRHVNSNYHLEWIRKEDDKFAERLEKELDAMLDI